MKGSIRVVFGCHGANRLFKYCSIACKEQAIQKAIIYVWSLMGEDIDPWQYIKGMD